MSLIIINPERIAQVQTTVHKFVTDFSKPQSTDEDVQSFLSVYHPDIHWSDHAFLVTRVGHEAVLGLYRAWNHCNQPFRTEAIIPTASGAILELIWIGRCANDIVRPSGEVAVKASGKDYVCHVCLIAEIDEQGRITKMDEYYNRRWDDGIPQEKYAVLKGASLKTE
ncbi:hypothetical protein PV05_06819 [Exophiala xenobiotica]|uniref:SnoaL-like domain-containing protein n=1 Tax=Exophiala xenobiotica TaxID=348802 RepID=A0A0D2EGA5_9EURO|nr:uncharacterized protein PV05_06819 [Exophiala xenobiotica]KIW54463.1 hypothetical protein PV05_06819 [Exophiala xenobiotica]